jgi:hypothetical protein
MKKYTAKWATIHKNSVLLDHTAGRPAVSPAFETVIKDPEIIIDGGNLVISGQKVLFEFVTHGFFPTEEELKDYNKHTKRKKSLFSKEEHPYIDRGWVQLNKTENFCIAKTNWSIEGELKEV